MNYCVRQAFLLVLGGLALGVLVFVLLFTGVLTLVPASAVGLLFFALTALLSGGGLLVLTASVLRADRSAALADAWLCCGQLAAVGALGAVLTSLITLLTASLGIGLFIGVALVFFFLFLFLGGLVCFLRQYLAPRSGHGCGCC